MRFPIDVAFLSGDLTVLRVTQLKPWRVAVGGRGVRSTVETEAGSLERWGVRVGDQLEVREVEAGPSGNGLEPGGGAGWCWWPRRSGTWATWRPGPARCWRGRPDLLRGHPAHPGPAVGPGHLAGAGDRLLSLHGHNEAQRLARVAAAVAGGATVAVVSDAGTPGDLGPGRLVGGPVGRGGRDGQHGARAPRRCSARWW